MATLVNHDDDYKEFTALLSQRDFGIIWDVYIAARGVNHTIYPEVFFESHDKLISALKTICNEKIYKKGADIKFAPNEALQKNLDSYDDDTRRLIDRSFLSAFFSNPSKTEWANGECTRETFVSIGNKFGRRLSDENKKYYMRKLACLAIVYGSETGDLTQKLSTLYNDNFGLFCAGIVQGRHHVHTDDSRTPATYTYLLHDDEIGINVKLSAISIWELYAKVIERIRKHSIQKAYRYNVEDKLSKDALIDITIEGLKRRALIGSQEAETAHKQLQTILSSALDVDRKLNWNAMMHCGNFACASTLYAEIKSETNEFTKKYHDIFEWKAQFEQGDVVAVEKYINASLASSQYPATIHANCNCIYESNSKTIIVSFELPSPDDITDIIGYKLVATRKTIDPIIMKSKQKIALYENIIHQIALRTMHEVYTSVYVDGIVENVVFNGWTSGINKATGKDFRACILSVQAGRQEFSEINLRRVDVKECLRWLKALSAGPLSNLTPVKPIMELNRDDKRFVASVEVLDVMSEDTNLATMPWEDFEYLVRELFGKIFSKDGAEVKVTKASRDGGVDAIAFDPDSIRGGKYVIQAKRYNNVVPVSACRDLYGTMINEGAVKGILVTTSYFGSDSRAFAKDKPISLIDGANLVHMLAEHGYSFRINLKE